MKRLARSCMILLFCLIPAMQSAAQKADPATLARFMQKYQSYKSSLARYRFTINPQQLADPNVNFWAGQLAATDASIMGRPNDALFYFPIASPAPQNLPDPAHYRTESAQQWIIDRAPRYRIVMINEAHHVPQTRLLTISLLKPMWAAGFRYLALEALTNDGKNPVPAGYPENSSGEYTRDPVMSELVREAMKIGYTLVPYEANDRDLSQASIRESMQSRNLQRFLASHPDAKVLLHAGYSHTAKSDVVKISGATTMATDLVNSTGIRILSIDQVALTPLSLSSTDVIAAQAQLAKAFDVSEPVVFVNKTKDATAWSAYPGAYDASILLPVSPAQVIRPDWLSLGGHRYKVYMDANPCGYHFPCLIQAFYSGEPDLAIPADQIALMVPADTNTPLFLREGFYRLRYLTEGDQKFIERDFIVKPPNNGTRH
ncbi:MAG: hypothetical protein JSS25_08740 [Proteobacteria bacterium]|nr:hypothetical protein [Pseudomonadota bacterium]